MKTNSNLSPYFKLLSLFLFIFSFENLFSQNIAVNSTGTTAAALNMFEVTQANNTSNSVSIFSSNTGTGTNAYAIWAEATGATNKYAIVVPAGGGSVGIGTTTPKNTLHVLSDIPSGSTNLHPYRTGIMVEGDQNTLGGRVAIRQAGTNPCMTLYRNNGTIAAPTTLISGDMIGNLAFGGYDGTTMIASPGITSVAAETWAPTDNGWHLTFNTINIGSGGSTEKMRVTSEGSVGIGTTAPAAKLELIANSTNTTTDFIAAHFGGTQSVASSAYYYGLVLDPTYSAAGTLLDMIPLGVYNKNTSTGTVTTMHGVVSVPDNNAGGSITSLYGLYARPQNSAGGSVASMTGIFSVPRNLAGGTVTDMFGVHANPANTSTGTVTNIYGGQFISQKSGTGAVTNAYGVFSRVDNSNAAGTITNSYGVYIADPILTGTITNKYALVTGPTAGNVGIGTITPQGRLDVKGVGATSTTYGFGVRNSSDIWAMVILDDSKVGIGTITPQAALDVAGEFRTTLNTATLPASAAGGGLSVSWNRSVGNAEVNFYNIYNNASISYQFSQKTGAGTSKDLISIIGDGRLRFHGSTSGVTDIQTPAASGNYVLTLPPNDGNSGQVLQTDGSGTTTWVNGGTASGSGNIVLLYNDETSSALMTFTTANVKSYTIPGTYTQVKVEADIEHDGNTGGLWSFDLVYNGVVKRTAYINCPTGTTRTTSTVTYMGAIASGQIVRIDANQTAGKNTYVRNFRVYGIY